MTTKEEIPVGTIIGKVEAIDEDIGENAAVDYAITGRTIKVKNKNPVDFLSAMKTFLVTLNCACID